MTHTKKNLLSNLLPTSSNMVKMTSRENHVANEDRLNPGGGGGTPLYGLYRYVRPQRVWFSAVLVINRVSILADFGHFGHK